MPRAAIYARFSSDLQRDASIEDQIRVCQERAAREGWEVVQCYTDHAMSGASMNRPGIQQLIRDAADGKFDIVLAEALDRLSRDQGDTAHFYKRMNFHAIKIATLSEGSVGITDVAFKGAMNQIYLEEMKQKVLRGQRGRVEAGKITAGLAYGYAVVRKFGADGKPVAGEREIVPEQAEIVRRIFRDYAAGKSPRAIAKELNDEGVRSPSGRGWHPSTLYGSVKRGLGIINCELYRGRIVWNRTTELKEPGTNRRIPRVNAQDKLVVSNAEHLRIISEELWEAAKARQAQTSHGPKEFWKAQRPRLLLSGLLKCGVCGGGFSKANHGRYACSASRNARTCSNTLMIHQEELEQLVTTCLQSRLFRPELLKVFCEEYVRHVNALRAEQNAQTSRYQSELTKLEKEKKHFIDAIARGVPADEVKGRIIEIAERRTEIEKALALCEEAPAMLHPKMAGHYRRQIERLLTALGDDKQKQEARDALRNLIDKIVLSPNEARDELVVDLHGDLAGIVSMAEAQPDKQRKVTEMRLFTPPGGVLVGPEGQ